MGKKGKDKPVIIAAQTKIEKLVSDAEECIMVTSTKGNIEVTGIKGINYSHQAKGLLIGALDSYMIRPILQTINTVNQNLAAHVSNIMNMGKSQDKPVKKSKK